MDKDCKTCQHGAVLYQQKKEDRFSNAYTPTGFVRCSGPRYKGRVYFCRDSRKACDDYKQKERRT